MYPVTDRPDGVVLTAAGDFVPIVGICLLLAVVAWYLGIDVRDPTLWGLVAANLVPFAGVVVLGWSVGLLLVTYWVENGVTIGVACLKMLQAEGEATPEKFPDTDEFILDWPTWKFVVFDGGLLLVFWLAYGGVVGMVLTGTSVGGAAPVSVAGATLGFVVYHLGTYWVEFRRSRAYRETHPISVFGEATSRTIPIHGATLVGLFVAAVAGFPAVLVLVVVLCKMGLDIRGYWQDSDDGDTPATRDTGPTGP